MVGTAKGVTKSYDSVSRKERRRKARERNRKNNEEPEPPKQAAARLEKEEQKRQTEAAERLEKRRRTHSQNTGEEISTDDFKRLEENGKQQRRQSGRSSTDANGQTRMDAFFPRKMGGGAASSSHSEVNTIAERLPETLLQRDSDERGEPALASVTLTDEQTRVPEKMYLRLAFLRKHEIDIMKPSPARTAIRETDMIGPVSVEGSYGETAVKVDSFQFKELRSVIIASTFKALNKALENADWKVDRKYLSQRYRRGVNNSWTPAQVQIIIEAVEGKAGIPGVQSIAAPRSHDAAAKYLKDTYKKSKGYDWSGITRDQVRHVYDKYRDRLLGQSSSPKLGRPRLLSPGCEEVLKRFIRETLGGETSFRLNYYMDQFETILAKQDNPSDKAFFDDCKDPVRYLRNLIRVEGGSARQVTTHGSKELSKEVKLTHTTDNFLRLAYLVQKYGLEKHDVFNFDETAVRFHEDATGKVIARKGQKRVKGETFEGSLDHRACCTFIPMVSCAGEKLDPALIFKGTKGQTGAIPGNKDGFKAFQDFYDREGKHKVCFMQNKGKWSTNDTMVQWFEQHVIPQVHAAKEEREKRAAKETKVPRKYVVILDGVSTHCLSEKSGTPSWITQVQERDPDLVLLWLPPNMTGDLQPLDVNFNRPFKATYRPALARLKLYQSQEKAKTGEDTLKGSTSRADSSAHKLKDVVIKAIIAAYKSVPKDQIEKGWTKAGKFVYEENNVPDHGSGYHSAWDTHTQNEAVTAFNTGTLFHEGMRGGVSDVGGPQFIPKAGRKKKQTAEDATGQIPDAGSEASDDDDEAAASQQYSEYPSSQCPDEFIDAEGEEDEIIEALGAYQLGEGGPSLT